MREFDLHKFLLTALINSHPSGAVVETGSWGWVCSYCGGNRWFIVDPWCVMWTGYCIRCLYKQTRLMDVDAYQRLCKSEAKLEGKGNKKPVQKEV